MLRGLLFVLPLIIVWGCGESSVPLSAPEITFLGLSKDTMFQSSVDADFTVLGIGFFDSDGDLGAVPNNIIVTDMRDGAIYNTYTFPELPLQKGDAAEGTLEIILPTVCCLFPDNIQPCEAPPQYPTNDLIVEIYVLDAAGQESNRVTSDVITLICN